MCMGAPGAVEKGTATAALRQVVFVGFHRVRHAQAQFAEFRAQGLPGDAQQEGGPVLIPAGVFQDAGQHEPVQLPVDLRVQVPRVRTKPLAEERLRVEAAPRGSHRRGGRGGRLGEFGEEVRQQDRAVGAQQRLLQHALQLPHVPRPGVGAQALQRFRGDLAHLPAKIPADPPQVELGQQLQVVAALAQGGQVDGEHAQPIVQVQPELALVRPGLQVAVGGGDQAHVGADRLAATDALERLLLQYPQDLRLGRQRHVADLVKKQGAAVGLLEPADAAALRPGEGALLVAEQLALQQRLRDGGAVQGQKRRLGPRAVLVDGPGHQLLARAALAGDQHRERLVGDAADGLVHLLHGRARTDDGFARLVLVRRRPRHHGRLAHQAGDLQRLAEHAVQLLQVQWLEQVIVSPLPHRFDGRIGRPDHSDQYDRDAGVDLVDLPQDVHAGLVGQAQVEKNNVRPSVTGAFEALPACGGDLDPVRGRGEHLAHLVREQVRVVIDQEQAGHGMRAPAVGRSRCAPVIVRIGHEAVTSMTPSDSRPKPDTSEDLAVQNPEDLRQAEHAPWEHDRQLDSLLGLLPGSAYRALADEHWTALFVSKGVEDLTGYPPDEFTSRRLSYNDIMLPEDRSATREAVLTALRELAMYNVEHRIRHKDGSIRWIWSRGHGLFALDWSLRFIEGWQLDITHQKQAEEKLRESEQRWRGLTEALPQLVWSATPDGACDYFSTQW